VVKVKNFNQIIQGIVMIIIGVCLLFTWKQFALEIAKHCANYTKSSELFVKIIFHLISIVAILGGTFLIFKFFRS
jgi:hypothetical protein